MDLYEIKNLLQPATRKELWIDWIEKKLMVKEKSGLREIYDSKDVYDPRKVIAALKEGVSDGND
jgi:hypothetical protein